MTEKEIFEILIGRFLDKEEYKITDNLIEICKNDETMIIEFDENGKAKIATEGSFDFYLDILKGVDL